MDANLRPKDKHPIDSVLRLTILLLGVAFLACLIFWLGQGLHIDGAEQYTVMLLKASAFILFVGVILGWMRGHVYKVAPSEWWTFYYRDSDNRIVSAKAGTYWWGDTDRVFAIAPEMKLHVESRHPNNSSQCICLFDFRIRFKEDNTDREAAVAFYNWYALLLEQSRRNYMETQRYLEESYIRTDLPFQVSRAISNVELVH